MGSMKDIVVLFLALLLMRSCIIETEYTNQYVLQNETSHSIKIQAYYRLDILYLEKSERIFILPHGSYTVDKQAGYHSEPLGVFNRWEIDSISIVFDEEKLLVQYCDSGPLSFCKLERNLMDFDAEYDTKKIGRSSGKDECRFTYTFTENDYEKAVNIQN